MANKEEDNVVRLEGDLGRVLLIDSHAPSLQRGASVLGEAGFDVVTASSHEEVVDADALDVIVLADSESAERTQTVAAIREVVDEPDVPLVLLLGKGTTRGPSKARAALADAALVRPVSGPSLVAIVTAFSQVRQLRKRLVQRERQLEQAMREGGRVDPRTGFYTLDSFKPILAAEVKRARRYKYPFSIAIAAMDELADVKNRWGSELADVLEGGLRLAVSRCLRDLDLPVAYGSGQVLIVMPHTPRRGARVVTDRMRKSISSQRMNGPNGKIGTTVSIGIASYEGEGDVSFGGLAQEAAAALKIAVERGGNRVAELPVTRRRNSRTS